MLKSKPFVGNNVSARQLCSKRSQPRVVRQVVDQEASQALQQLQQQQSNASIAAEPEIAMLAQTMLANDLEAAEQLQRYEAAIVRLEKARAAAVKLEEMMAEAAIEAQKMDAEENRNLEQKAAEIMANAEVAAAEKLLQAAELKAKMAAEDAEGAKYREQKDKERVESVKGGIAAAAAGLVASAPLAFTAGDASLVDLLSLASGAASCFLFGVTYRYAIGQDLNNTHLRGGVWGAFGLVRAAVAAEFYAAASPANPFDIGTVIAPAALFAGQSMLMFGFATVGLEAALRAGLVRRFGDSGMGH